MDDLRILVTGGRNYRDVATIRFWMGVAFGKYGELGQDVTLVHGGASGADSVAAHLASGLGWRVEPHFADWPTHGNAAGPIRNEQMVRKGAHVCVAFPGGRGTADCRDRAAAAGIPVIDVAEEGNRG